MFLARWWANVLLTECENRMLAYIHDLSNKIQNVFLRHYSRVKWTIPPNAAEILSAAIGCFSIYYSIGGIHYFLLVLEFFPSQKPYWIRIIFTGIQLEVLVAVQSIQSDLVELRCQDIYQLINITVQKLLTSMPAKYPRRLLRHVLNYSPRSSPNLQTFLSAREDSQKNSGLPWWSLC